MSLFVEFNEIGPATGSTPVQVGESDFLACTSGDAAAFAIKHGCMPTNLCIGKVGRHDHTEAARNAYLYSL